MLSRFQRECEESLREFVEFRGLRITQREVISNGEVFVVVSLDENAQVWIYVDEVEYCIGRRHRNFEAGVFREERARISAFLEHLSRDLGAAG